MAWVPGGKVMANVSGSPSDLALSTIGFRALGSAATLPFHSAFNVIACPFRLRSQGIIIGFLGDPKRPMVEAMGMPISICVACRSPLESESRMAAQLAPFEITELMPYFLNKPFSWAITMGEQSVRAIIPNFSVAISGASLAYTLPIHALGKPDNRAARAVPRVALARNCRRLWAARKDFIGSIDFMLGT